MTKICNFKFARVVISLPGLGNKEETTAKKVAKNVAKAVRSNQISNTHYLTSNAIIKSNKVYPLRVQMY